MKDDEIEIPVQINREEPNAQSPSIQMEIRTRFLQRQKEALGDKVNGTIRKEIYVPGRIVNLVVK